MSDCRPFGPEEEPDGGQEGEEQRDNEQHEESVRRPSSRGDPLVEVVHRLMDLEDLLFGDLCLRRAGGSARTEE